MSKKYHVSILSVVLVVIIAAVVVFIQQGQTASSKANVSVKNISPVEIPHTLVGREKICLSCHNGTQGIPQTPHPDRTNCLQCHIPRSAVY